MNEERTKILEMLKDGKIGVADAEKLLAALSSGDAGGEPQSAGRPQVQIPEGPGRARARTARARTRSISGSR